MVSTGDKLGASRAVVEAKVWNWPLHGLRRPPVADTNGLVPMDGRADAGRRLLPALARRSRA